jgi:hypothetical protein
MGIDDGYRWFVDRGTIRCQTLRCQTLAITTMQSPISLSSIKKADCVALWSTS